MDMREVTRLEMVGNWRKHALCHESHCSALANDALRMHSPRAGGGYSFYRDTRICRFLREVSQFSSFPNYYYYFARQTE